MGKVIEFHALTSSAGYKSGRSSDRETPVARSTAMTRKGGTTSHCDRACGVIPIRFASTAELPATAMARFRAFVLLPMGEKSSIALDASQEPPHCTGKGVLYSVVMTLGKRIQAARKKANLTQKQVGAALGITDAAVSEWERDESSPEIERLAKLVRVLKTTANWLVDGKGDPPGPDDPETLLERLTPAARRQAIRLLRMLAEDDSAAA